MILVCTGGQFNACHYRREPTARLYLPYDLGLILRGEKWKSLPDGTNAVYVKGAEIGDFEETHIQYIFVDFIPLSNVYFERN